MISSLEYLRRSAVEVDREHERSRQRQVEVVNAANARRRAANARLRIETGILRPCLEIPPGEPDFHAAHAQGSRDPRLVERIAEGDLAQLHVAGILDARGIDSREGAGGEAAVAIPILSDRELDA